MKFATPFALAAITTLLAASSESASAAECTAEQLLTNGEIQSVVSSAAECKKINFATSSQAEVCADTKCLDVITAAVKKLESCTISGMSLKDTLEVAIAGCKGSSGNTTTTTTATSAPAASDAAAGTPATPAPSSTVTPTPSSSAASMETSAITAAAASIVAVYAMRM